MATIIRETTVAVPAEQAWAALREWENLHNLASGFVTDTQVEGDERVVTFFTGDTARELIVTVDDAQRRLVWSVTESPFDLRHHNGSTQIHPDGTGCRLVWTADFLPEELTPMLVPLMGRGLDAIRQTLEAR